METKTKTSAKPKVGKAPTAKAETPKMKLLNTAKIEEAQVIEPQNHKPNLEETSKIISSLHEKIRHVTRLGFYIDRLDEFEIEQKDEDLLKQDHYYQGCTLTIRDDKRKEFELKNPVLIGKVIDFLGGLLQDRRSEIEAEIILP